MQPGQCPFRDTAQTGDLVANVRNTRLCRALATMRDPVPRSSRPPATKSPRSGRPCTRPRTTLSVSTSRGWLQRGGQRPRGGRPDRHAPARPSDLLLRRRPARPPRRHPVHLPGTGGLLEPAREVTAGDPSRRRAEATQPQDDFVARFAQVFGHGKTQVLAPAYPEIGSSGGIPTKRPSTGLTPLPTRTAGKLLVQRQPPAVLRTRPELLHREQPPPLCPTCIWRKRSTHEAQRHRS